MWWVDSTIGSDSNSYGSSRGNYPHRPFKTVSHAIAAAVANNGDMIMVAPNHTETITAAGGWTVPAGVQIVGYQAKDGDRPQITFSTATTASILMSGANSSISGIIGICGIASLANPVSITAANCSVDMEWRDASSATSALRAILTNASATGLNINLKYVGVSGTAVTLNAVRLVGSANNRINLDAFGTFNTGCVEFLTTAGTNTVITGQINNSLASTTHVKNIVDTVTGSHYAVNYFDTASASTSTAAVIAQA